MTPSREINLRDQPVTRPRLSPRLRNFGTLALSLPGLSTLRSLAHRAFAAMEPAGRGVVRISPASGNIRGDDMVITVLSANLWHDWPRQRSRLARLEALAKLMEREGVDVALLQEVSRTHALAADEWLADELGMSYAYARANGHERVLGFEEGLAVFSRYPLRTPRLREFRSSAAPLARRIALGATLQTPAGELDAFSVHLSVSPWQNARQINQLRHWVDEVARDRPAFIGGDFNAGEGTPQIAQARRVWHDLFRQKHPEREAFTHEIQCPVSRKPLRRTQLDYLFLQPNGHGWMTLEAEHLDTMGTGISDHRAVLARLALRS